MWLTFGSCCFCFNLRLDTTIIAYICLMFELISLALNSLTILVYNQWILFTPGNILTRFFFFLFVLFLGLKLSLCVTLIISIQKKMPDYLDMWYKGYAILECAYLFIVIIEAVRVAAKPADIALWEIVGGQLLTIVITFNFILVFRSYYLQMKNEPNFYRDLSIRLPADQNIHSKKPENTNEDIVIFSNPTYEEYSSKKCSLTPSSKIGSGVVYVTPQSGMFPIQPMPAYYLNDLK